MTERLETIKELVKKIESIIYDEWRQQELTNLIESLYYDDHVDWLINRVEELEEREKLYKETIQSYGRLADGFIDDIESLVKRNEHYKQALEFYADKENHVAPFLYTGNDGTPVHDESEVDMDEGKIARQALGQEESK